MTKHSTIYDIDAVIDYNNVSINIPSSVSKE